MSRVRIRSVTSHGLHVEGKDIVLELLHEDGTTTPLPSIMSLSWNVGGRLKYSEATVVFRDVEIDVEADVQLPS